MFAFHSMQCFFVCVDALVYLSCATKYVIALYLTFRFLVLCRFYLLFLPFISKSMENAQQFLHLFYYILLFIIFFLFLLLCLRIAYILSATYYLDVSCFSNLSSIEYLASISIASFFPVQFIFCSFLVSFKWFSLVQHTSEYKTYEKIPIACDINE